MNEPDYKHSEYTIIQVRSIRPNDRDPHLSGWTNLQGYVCRRCGCAVLIGGTHEQVCHE